MERLKEGVRELTWLTRGISIERRVVVEAEAIQIQQSQ